MKAGLLVGRQAAAPPAPFFGAISMYREFWAEDPSWTNPGDGNACTDARDNGTAGADLGTAVVAPSFTAAGGPNGRPSYDFTGGNKTFKTTTGTSGTEFTVFAVVEITNLGDNAITDAGTGNQAYTSQENISGQQWRAYNTGGIDARSAAIADGAPHLMVTHFKANATTIYIDGVSVATDTSGSISAATGFVIGANYAVSASYFSGYIPYVGMYAGDLTGDGDYAAWAAAVMSYYGI